MVSLEALIRLLAEKEIFTREEFLEKVISQLRCFETGMTLKTMF